MSTGRILIIDDNSADIHVLRLALEELGEPFVLEVIEDGGAALRYVREYRSGTRESEPCVIVLDLHLPQHNGLDILAAIREEPALTHMKVIMLTGLASRKEQADMEALGAFYRRKPSDFSEFSVLAREIVALCKGAIPAIA